MIREAKIERKTKETDISVLLNLDGNGNSDIETSISFMDHMLCLFAAHGFFDMEVKASGDTDIDDHHTVEDLGICIGRAIRDALRQKTDIKRYAEVTLPMDEVLVRVVIDISNRPVLAYRVKMEKTTTGSFDVGLVKEFFRALVVNAGITMHVDLIAGDEPHHISEAIFKAFARALDHATSFDKRLDGSVPSTKGLL